MADITLMPHFYKLEKSGLGEMFVGDDCKRTKLARWWNQAQLRKSWKDVVNPKWIEDKVVEDEEDEDGEGGEAGS